MSYPGPERRKENIQMQEDIAVMKNQIATLKEEEEELDRDVKILTKQITTLCVQLPALTKSIETLTRRIDAHENNAVQRTEDNTTHRLQCGRISTNIKILWGLIPIIFGLIIALFNKK